MPRTSTRASEAKHQESTSDKSTDSAPSTLPEASIEEVWRAYKDTAADELRDYLIEKYRHLVKWNAWWMHKRLPERPGGMDVEDLKSAGLVGLIDAVDKFDLERGVKFETYCTQRIRRAVVDELRAMDWLPRLVRSRTAKVERARRVLEMELGRPPTDPEVCDRLRVSDAEFKKLLKDSKPVNVVSQNHKWLETDSSKDILEIDVIQDNRPEDPLTELQKKDLKLLITKGLSPAEGLIVILYYYEEMTAKEIGLTLDLSESHIRKLHRSILARLQETLQREEW
ncbi:MAG: sigma-70 family RNA polymerase sigma factor [Planctomycetota bacterium]|jgi:RNA polymerase sigma factor for flagellar operon FliA